MLLGAKHELTKEQDRNKVFAHVLKFIGKRLQNQSQTKPIGQLGVKDFLFKLVQTKSTINKAKVLRRILKIVIIYLIIGVLKWLRRGGSKSASLFFWPIPRVPLV